VPSPFLLVVTLASLQRQTFIWPCLYNTARAFLFQQTVNRKTALEQLSSPWTAALHCLSGLTHPGCGPGNHRTSPNWMPMPSGSIHAHRREVCYSRSASRWPSAARPNRTHARSSGERSDDRRNTLICRISVVSVVRTWHQFSRRDCSLAGTALALFTLFRAIPCDRNHTGAPCCRGTEGHHPGRRDQ